MSDRVLGQVLSYRDLHSILRERAEELGLSRLEIDAIAGIPVGYAAKLLSPTPMKKLGDKSMPFILPALGVKLLVVADSELTAALQRRSTVRTRLEGRVHSGTVNFVLSARHMKRIARRGGANSRAYMSKAEASRLARLAVNARWAATRKRKEHAVCTIGRKAVVA